MNTPFTPFEAKIQSLLSAALVAHKQGQNDEAIALFKATERYITMAKSEQPLHPDIDAMIKNIRVELNLQPVI